jgi:hypothetical protein
MFVLILLRVVPAAPRTANCLFSTVPYMARTSQPGKQYSRTYKYRLIRYLIKVPTNQNRIALRAYALSYGEQSTT